MKKNFKFIYLLVSAVLFMVSCNSDDENSEITPPDVIVDTTTVDTTSIDAVLCDGNGTNSYYPMTVTDTWTYKYKIAGFAQSPNPVIKVLNPVEYNSVSYSQFTDLSNFMYLSENYFRFDSVTSNVYYYDDNNNVEYLYLPANPALNQTWDYFGTIGYNSRKVTNLAATLTTDFCTYTDLLEITQYDDNGVVRKRDYYKKGIGLVQNQYFDSFFGTFDTFTLIDITLH